jgi:hypothetical protein
MRFLLLMTLVLGTLLLASGSSAHVRYSGSCDSQGYCEYFYGNTVSPSNHSNVIDPINIVWYPYGWITRVNEWILGYQYGWTADCGSNQHNYRLLGSMSGGTYWGWANQNQQAGSNGCPLTRYHLRLFYGHSHGDSYNDWTIADAHHEACCDHHIDRGWEQVEDTVRSLGSSYGHGTKDNWSYLPRADRTFQGYASNGWASRITANYP